MGCKRDFDDLAGQVSPMVRTDLASPLSEPVATKGPMRQGDVETGCRAVIHASKTELRIMRYELTDREGLRSGRCCPINRAACRVLTIAAS